MQYKSCTVHGVLLIDVPVPTLHDIIGVFALQLGELEQQLIKLEAVHVEAQDFCTDVPLEMSV